MKIVHIITGLGDGGAEHVLFKVCKYDIANKHLVISLKGPGKYYTLLNKLGIKVYCLNISFFSIHKFFFLIKLLRSLKPDIVQTWLVHADFLGSIAARLAGINNILWNVRYSNIEIGKAKLTTILIIKILSKLSYLIPKFILIVSRKAKKIYEIVGYNKRIFKFIPNGFDLSILKINKLQKINFRKKIKIKKNITLIGNVARYDPQKDHLNLLNALSLIRKKNINFFCVLVGSNVNQNNTNLIFEIKKLKLSNHVKLLGQSDNISEVMNGLDIHVLSSSYGEGFPNVVAEAMGCGTPCIVTDVGDSALIVGKTGWVVPPENSIKLAKAIEKALNEKNTNKWNKRCNKARLRVKKNYNISRMVKLYNKVWSKVYKRNDKNI
ncbi:glycosyltransferase [Candidatus Pelagibacter ubique]|nr:glycosyltransferase [Candidatus Pelagibacter ubique]